MTDESQSQPPTEREVYLGAWAILGIMLGIPAVAGLILWGAFVWLFG